ncbi:succinate dehydrogenase assembly factor 2 [Primorskyibacter sp. 2E233]|uniref:FAD assembly factor SdhE n=1 Tax=Primorskyibacter sp. 2E233 TaxID=3413431 RepID=UPI003BF25937
MFEDRETRKKRLAMRSMRRGMKEMDILLIRYSEAKLAGMSDPELDAYEAVLSENDQDLYQWVSGQVPAPKEHFALIEDIREVASGAG